MYQASHFDNLYKLIVLIDPIERYCLYKKKKTLVLFHTLLDLSGCIVIIYKEILKILKRCGLLIQYEKMIYFQFNKSKCFTLIRYFYFIFFSLSPQNNQLISTNNTMAAGRVLLFFSSHFSVDQAIQNEKRRGNLLCDLKRHFHLLAEYFVKRFISNLNGLTFQGWKHLFFFFLFFL